MLCTGLLAAAPVAAANPRHRHHHGHAARHDVLAVRAVGACAGADTPALLGSTQALRDAVLCLINKQRAAHHLPQLRESTLLDRSAQSWTNAMVNEDFFSHGSDFAARISAVGFDWSQAGENIATGFPTPDDVVAAWMASKDHCENILSPAYSYVGTGVDRRAVRGWASGPATWTQDFALPMGRSLPSGSWGPAAGCPY